MSTSPKGEETIDGQTRRKMIHKQRRDKEKRDMAYIENQPYIARKYRVDNARRITPAELAMFNILLSIDGIKFVFQKPIKEYKKSNKFYIADFYILPPHKIVIEADGGYHNDTREYDAARDAMMKKHGIRVMRFTNEEILSNPDKVKIRIDLAIIASENLNAR